VNTIGKKTAENCSIFLFYMEEKGNTVQGQVPQQLIEQRS
jgi:hypothetical protein